jgi:cytochrome P450
MVPTTASLLFDDALSSLPDEMASSGVTLPLSFATVFLFGLLIFVAPLLAFYAANRPSYIPKKIPGPPRLPLLGILPYLLKHWKQMPVESMRLSRKFKHVTWGGPCFKYGAWFYTDDPSIVKHILKENFQNYEKGDVFRGIFHELLGNGIFATDGVAWESHRKISSRLFSRNLLKYSCQVFARNCRILVEQLEKAASESHAIDLQDLFLRLTIDNTAETTFGLKMNCLRSGKQPLFASAFDEMQILCLDRFVDPLFEIKRFFQLGHQERRIRHLQSVLDLFCKGIVHHLFTREAFFSSPNHRHEFTSFWLNGFQDLGFSSLVASF